MTVVTMYSEKKRKQKMYVIYLCMIATKTFNYGLFPTVSGSIATIECYLIAYKR